jgi:hypothetical protein
MQAKLSLSSDGKRHVLEGRPIALGDTVELKLSGGRWLRCRYRWNGDPETQPVFSIVLGGVWERRLLRDARALEAAPEAVLRMELEDAEFRWPTSN